MDYIDTYKLPPIAQEMVDLLGDELAYHLMRHCGGTTVNVPVKATAACALQNILNKKQMKKLVTHYRGERLDVPKYDSVARQVRDAKIRALRKEGWTIPRIARQFGCTERHVYYVIGDNPEPPESFDLFEHIPL